MTQEQYVGQGVDRNDVWQLLTGEGAFVADLRREGTLHAAFVRSSMASARLRAVDVEAARRLPGVVAVVTGAELAEHVQPIRPPANSVSQTIFRDFYGVVSHPRQIPPLAVDEVRYVGEPIAVVVATDRYVAEDAVQLVEVDYEARPAVWDVAHALDDDAPVVHQDLEDNTAVSLTLVKGEIPHHLDGMVVIEGEYRIARQAGLSMEGRGVLACPEDGRVQIWTSSQVPFIVRQLLCAATGWDVERVRIRTPEVGGGFGPKASVYAEEIVVPWLADRLGAPVSWIEDRYENLTTATQARDNVHRTRLVLDAGGHIVSWEDDYLVDLGVHNLWMVGVVGNTAMHLLGAYRIPNVRVSGTGVFSNKTPTSQYRGAGRPEACFVLERSLDRAADELGIHPAKLRAVNILGAADLPYRQGVPYRDGVEITYDGKDYARVLDKALELVPEGAVAELRGTAAPHERVGFGIGVYMEATARGPAEPETARVRLLRDGTLEVATGTGPSGQAHKTVFAQVAADVLQASYDRVRVITGDTDTVSQGLGSFASRGAVVAGSAVRVAAEELGALVSTKVSGLLGEVAVLGPGGLHVGAAGRVVTWPEVAELIDASPEPPDTGSDESAEAVLSVSNTFAPPTVTWTMGVHTVAIKVDVETGHVQVMRYGVAHETGPSLNPRVVDGQIRGGVAQGIGGALLEHVDHDASGQPLSATLADYLVPEATDVPAIALAHLDMPSQLNPLGIRGVGESGIIATGAAIAGAVDDALAEFDIHVDRTPMTSEYLLDLIARAQA